MFDYLIDVAERRRKSAGDALHASPGSDLARRLLELAAECELEAASAALARRLLTLAADGALEAAAAHLGAVGAWAAEVFATENSRTVPSGRGLRPVSLTGQKNPVARVGLDEAIALLAEPPLDYAAATLICLILFN